jgi:hypothetical protein
MPIEKIEAVMFFLFEGVVMGSNFLWRAVEQYKLDMPMGRR